ncbi:MAG TPA: Fe2+-dependent dioxygenase [Alphaproteobacteria bacterium]|nr:Fe2+-dependent dioxygenase [Alphaproteobacteria bacterium]
MVLCIADLLPPDRLAALRAGLAACRFVDGRATAGWHAATVKANTQVAGDDPGLAALRGMVERALAESALFQLAVRPKALTPPLFSRYGAGMAYGSHVDDALMGGLRTDVSFTLFLSEPDAYEGGELVIETTAGEQAFKLAAGSLVLYPSTTLHRVAPVGGGMRDVAVGWAQSLVRDPARRELLFELDTARRGLFAREGKSAEFDLISKSLANLLRMWAEV